MNIEAIAALSVSLSEHENLVELSLAHNNGGTNMVDALMLVRDDGWPTRCVSPP